MSLRRVRLAGASREGASPAGASREGVGLGAQFDRIREELDVPAAFPAEILDRAEWAAAHPDLPANDLTGVPFFTIDPAGSTDLDQAMHLGRDGAGYRVRYAIADLPAVVTPGDAVDQESWRRGQTVYAPDRRTPLHPPRLSEDAASLLPGVTRAAYVWDLRLDADGAVTGAGVQRGLVRSTDRLAYDQVQAALDGGSDDERYVLLREIGLRRVEQERARGGASLPLPEQDVVAAPDGSYRLEFRPPVPAEEWNAQISLMTGIEAARLMLEAGVGILRTMPPPEENAVRRLQRQARGLDVPWPTELSYGELLRSLDRSDPRHLALVHEATALFRGAGYTPFDGAAPQQPLHAAVAAAYAHVTAPLRRLVDRFGLAVCEAVCRDGAVPAWAREALPRLPEVMQRSDAKAAAVERACTDAVEAAVLQHRLGEVFEATVVDVRRDDLLVQVAEPAVLAVARGHAEAGERVRARLATADVAARTVRFEIVER
ncbi:MAG TPA: RNB domain-containing ribonuclease [Dermatophilaceae bacterium]|nr:RNB domain-containing ribonuclease [Dermatophilaceae bacterium]